MRHAAWLISVHERTLSDATAEIMLVGCVSVQECSLSKLGVPARRGLLTTRGRYLRHSFCGCGGDWSGAALRQWMN